MILLSCKRLLALTAIFLACYLIAPSYLNAQMLEKEWTLIRGIASEIAVGADGSVVAVDNSANVYKFEPNKKDWISIGKSIKRVAIDSNGKIWGIDKSGTLRTYTGTNWQPVGQGAQELIAGPNNIIYVVTNTGNVASYNSQTQKWTNENYKALKLAIDGKENLWRIAENGDIARKLDDAWIGVIGKAQDITADQDGRIFIAGQDNRLYEWQEGTASWKTYPQIAARSITANAGQIWRTNESGKIFAIGLSTPSQQEGISQGERGDGAVNPANIADTSDIIFERVPDNTLLSDLSIGADGSVFGLNSSGEIRRWSNTEQRFNIFPGQVNQLIVQDNGLPLSIGTQGNLIEHDGEAWRSINLNLSLIDIALSANNQVLAINNKNQIAKLSERRTSFSLLPQRGQKIAAQKNGEFWAIDSMKRLFKCDIQGLCTRQSINAADIAIGPAGSVFIIDTNANLRQYNPDDKSFEIIRQGDTARVAVGPQDRPWILNNNGLVLQSGYFERDESGDRRLALKTEATEEITQAKNNNNTGIQITQSISFTAVNIPTSAGGVNLGSGMSDITSGFDDIVIATGFDDSPCHDGTGRNWVYNPVSRNFSHLEYLKRANLFVGISVNDLVRGSVNGDKPPSSPSPAITSFIGEWLRLCGIQSNLLTYKSSVFTNPSIETTQNFDGAVMASPLDDDQLPDIDIAADGTIANIAPANELEIFQAEKADDVSFFDQLEFMRVGIGKDKYDLWVVSTTYNVYEFVSSSDRFELRSHNADDKAQDIGVGHDGTVFIVNTSGVLKKWDPATKRFVRTNKNGVTRVAVDSRGNPIVANFPSSQTVYFGK